MVDLWHPLQDAPVFPAERYAGLAKRIGKLMKTENDVLLIQAEAVVALEAVAASLARPGLKALNISTSIYGAWFGNWLTRGGASVVELAAAPARPVSLDAVAAALDRHGEIAVLSLVHAESASGICNPLAEITAIARSRGIVTVVDAVASIGGHSLDVDALGIDIAVIGPQKALAGPAGLSALSITPAAWALAEKAGGPQSSILSLLDQKAWIESGRAALPGTSAPLEFFALEAALKRIEAEGIEQTVARHETAAKAARAALSAMGAVAWTDAPTGSNLVTTARLPEGIDAGALLAAAPRTAELSAGVGPGAERLIRLNHTGRRARFDCVLASVVAYGMALRRLGVDADLGRAANAVADHYS